jgi:2-oxoglutarate dehydrogenase E2 component (dihydrolipoamide succinyltransferase)
LQATLCSRCVCTAANTVPLWQIDVAVNAPEAGTIKEFLANEEDTVTVGQDLLRIETGAAPEGGAKPEAKEAKGEPKEETKKEAPPPEKKSETESKPEPKKEETKQESKPAPAPPKESKPSKPEPKKGSDAAAATSGLGNREERRVSDICSLLP